ncbi:hypothetical protein DICPUDRAFT_146570 [Dictyostelium purpureum]|uniref:Uncharacterized protein n=1 Tax=Dictyostelium purpureum TaxID=5786 RepID=F0Z6B0_DICPU|nr:uncharacterized protein DICPUDRAFT_146570 [Dictyostelium purpureum]EGC40572.1 hypothetical protein DICPUDRAFT_146570 [Dictyostelium purpureum]|eukprot:XP_003282908.1 hypothetical protein DICPUDRAFT_146570 [Dictyostelium purpureum]
MLSLEERLKIKKEEEKEIEQIKTSVLSKVRKEKTFFDYVKFYFLKMEAETGLYFGTTFEKYVYGNCHIISYIYNK